ncbi:enoyl-ACP reductase FabV [Streptomyces alkaliphilus]|uniref:enoyl-ACP reductase FabV n=1 Tax=Streptomyces alkaliphilus TaxID=1472722 RepID=UPI00117EF1CB|nr:enoyl-ACP reductase FabV [Streptomyces alkaliphilus]MQS06042.1 enoyl-[acyl-carrier-protein] reductase FabV [Streptomyces alkaliphilus]
MIIEPVRRGATWATAHPDGRSLLIRRTVDAVRARGTRPGPRAVLVVGASSGLGLATRLSAAFGHGAATVGVCLERPGTRRRPGTAGWYNAVAVQRELAAAGLYGRLVVGDAFTDEVKERTARLVAGELGGVDLVVHSVAAPRRADPATGRVHRSVIKTIGEPFTEKAYDASSASVRVHTTPAGTAQEIDDTVRVMGGADWARWIDVLEVHGALLPGARTVAFSYVGNSWLAPTYRDGTLGRAKQHLESTARTLHRRLTPRGGAAHAAVMRALVTPASQAMPVQALYTLLLHRVTREAGLLETTDDQARRLLDHLYAGPPATIDASGRIRLDDIEMRDDVQEEIRRRWDKVHDSASLAELGDLDAYLTITQQLHGFAVEGVDYAAATDPVRPLPDALMIPDPRN